MNYRHAFHAGGFADVLKHAVLTRVILHLREKPAAFRVIDTHAGAGLYDLTGPDAERTGEWRAGIGRLLADPPGGTAGDLLAPYLAAVAGLNPDGRLTRYPGSPALALALLRPHDRLLACELEPGAARELAALLRADPRARAVAIDGWKALRAFIPAKERRGLVLVDPAFEQPGEFARLVDGLAAAHRKWATGIYLLWYPVKRRRDADAFVRHVAALDIPAVLRAELTVAAASEAQRLSGSGLLVVNPPWRLHEELAALLPALAAALSEGSEGAARLDWITGGR